MRLNETLISYSGTASGNGVLTYVSHTSLLSEETTDGKGAAIRIGIGGSRLYVTERSTENIFVFSVDNERLTLLQRIDCRGTEPRDILIVGNGNYAICANQFANKLPLCVVLVLCRSSRQTELLKMAIRLSPMGDRLCVSQRGSCRFGRASVGAMRNCGMNRSPLLFFLTFS